MTIDPSTLLVIAAAGLATYATRLGGYLLIQKLHTIPPRLQAALDAVPAAVLTALVAPTFVSGDWEVKIALVVAAVVALRFPGLIMLAAGWLVAMLARHGLGL